MDRGGLLCECGDGAMGRKCERRLGLGLWEGYVEGGALVDVEVRFSLASY